MKTSTRSILFSSALFATNLVSAAEWIVMSPKASPASSVGFPEYDLPTGQQQSPDRDQVTTGDETSLDARESATENGDYAAQNGAVTSDRVEYHDDEVELDLYDVQVIGAACNVSAKEARAVAFKKIVLFNMGMTAAAGSSHTLREGRKLCQYLFDFNKTPGFQFRLVDASFDTLVSIRSNATGMVKIASFHQGQASDTEAIKSYTRSRGGNDESIDFTNSEWSTCDDQAVLVLGTEVRARKGSDANSHAHVSLVGPVKLRLEWRKCS